MAAAATKVMTEQNLSSNNHTNNSKPELGASWKDKLTLPERDNRVKTAVSGIIFTKQIMYLSLMETVICFLLQHCFTSSATC